MTSSKESISAVKPKFQVRRSVVTDNRLRELQNFGGQTIPHSDYHLILEDMVYMSIRRHGRPLPMLKLQGEILKDLVDYENSVSIYKKKLEELKRSNAPEEEIKYVESEWYKYRRLKYALRDIGDGIAWRFLGFDRFILSQIGKRPRKPHINIQGTEKELYELAETMNKHDEVALLNDLTNILKKGDITAKRPDGTFELIEVKSSTTKNCRVVRQKRDLEETVSFINDGEMMKDSELFRALTLPIDPRSYFEHFEKFLVRAEKVCALTERIGDHLVLQISDFTASKLLDDPEPVFKKHFEIVDSWRKSGDFILNTSSVDRYSHVQNYAPFSIFPIEHRFRVKLMTGAIHVNTSINVSSVLRYLAKRGWTVIKEPKDFRKEVEENELTEIAAGVLKKGPLTLELPMPIVGRLAHEFLSVATLGDMLDSILEAGQSTVNAVFTNFEGEAGQWD